MPKKNKYPLIYVEWCDAIENLDGWHTKSKALKWAKNDNWIVKQVGWLLIETDEYMLLSSESNKPSAGREGVFSGLFKVPKTWILKRKEIKL